MSEWSVLEAKVKTLEQQVSALSKLTTPIGGLHSDVFQNSGPFSVLPTAFAAMTRSSASPTTALTIADNTWTVVADFVPATNSSATISLGLEVAPSSGEIKVSGIPGESVTLINMFAAFGANSSGVRGVGWLSDTGDGKQVVYPAATPTAELTHLRRIKSGYTSYKMEVYQNSGGPLDVNLIYFAVARIR